MEGIGTPMMRNVQEIKASEFNLKLSMLHCSPHMLPSYSQLGWTQAVILTPGDQPGGIEPQIPVNMILNCGHKEQPNG